MLVDDLPELVNIFGQSSDIPNQHEICHASRHISKNLMAPP